MSLATKRILPDYTAYNEMLSLFKNFSAIPIPLSKQDGYHMHPDKIAEEIARGTSVILTSNPRNPTGQVLTNPQLAQIQDICKFFKVLSTFSCTGLTTTQGRDRATLVMDEFYSGE